MQIFSKIFENFISNPHGIKLGLGTTINPRGIILNNKNFKKKVAS